jgi:acetyltransferase-like isoleucine patch superfamily enzyme
VSIHETATIHPNVTLGEDAQVGAYVIIGEPPRGREPGEVPTVIGPGAVIRSHTVIYAVSVGTGSVIEHHVIIANSVRIHSQAFIPEMSVLGEGCWIGPRVCVTNAKYPLSPTVKNDLIGATIEPGAKIGANSTLLPGVRVGADALVGAGSVVVRDVEAEAVVVGNPARSINEVKNLPYVR